MIAQLYGCQFEGSLMKKISLLFSVLVTASAHASLPVTTCSSVSAPLYNGNFVVGLTGLWWQASPDQLDYVQVFHTAETVLGNIRPFNLHEIDTRYDVGYRVNIGYLFPCSSSELSFAYTDYQHHDRDHVIAAPGDALNSTRGTATTTAAVPIGAVILTDITLPAVSIESSISSPAVEIDLSIPGPTIDIPDVTVFPAQNFFIFPAAPTIATATFEIQNHVLDFDYRHHVCWGCGNDFHWQGGVRYADVDQTLRANFFGNVNSLFTPAAAVELSDIATTGEFTVIVGETTTTATADVSANVDITVQLNLNLISNFREIIREKSEFNGIGPRLGFGGTYNVYKGFGLVGDLSAALLIGNVENNYEDRFVIDTTGSATTTITSGVVEINATGTIEGEPDVDIIVNAIPIALADATLVGPDVPPATTVVEHRFNNKDNLRIVPNIDAKLGVSYTSCIECTRSKFTVEAGYLASHYFNANDRIRSFGNQSFTANKVFDTSFSGPYVSMNFAL